MDSLPQAKYASNVIYVRETVLIIKQKKDFVSVAGRKFIDRAEFIAVTNVQSLGFKGQRKKRKGCSTWHHIGNVKRKEITIFFMNAGVIIHGNSFTILTIQDHTKS